MTPAYKKFLVASLLKDGIITTEQVWVSLPDCFYESTKLEEA